MPLKKVIQKKPLVRISRRVDVAIPRKSLPKITKTKREQKDEIVRAYKRNKEAVVKAATKLMGKKISKPQASMFGTKLK